MVEGLELRLFGCLDPNLGFRVSTLAARHLTASNTDLLLEGGL